MVTETTNTINAYTAIADFFDVFNLPDAAKYIRTSLLAANSKKIWKRHSYADLILFYKCYRKLFSTAEMIVKSSYQRQEAVIQLKHTDPVVQSINVSLEHRLKNKGQYCLHLPCHLSAKEFCNPYKALKKAVLHLQHDKYDDLFDILLQYALCKDSLEDIGVGWDTLQLHTMMQKLTEAAHLLHVRTKTHPGESVEKKIVT